MGGRHVTAAVVTLMPLLRRRERRLLPRSLRVDGLGRHTDAASRRGVVFAAVVIASGFVLLAMLTARHPVGR
jgi:hypothetical protein